MVFNGTPSKACALCRTRKIRCDQMKPECTQCVRVKVRCPGYRNSLDLMFRDQTSDTRMFFNRRAIGLGDSQTAGIESNAVVNATNSFANMPYGLSSSSENLVIPLVFHYFFKDESDSGGFLIPKIERMSVDSGDTALSAALSALGYAILSNTRRSPGELIEGRRQYGKAVRLLSEALPDPAAAKIDEVLGTVNLLATFEALTCSDPQSMIAWSYHLEGAATLLSARERFMPKDRAGLRVFLQLRSQLLTSCLQRGTAVPEVVSKWSERYRPIMTADELYETQLADMMTNLANVRAAIVNQESLDSEEIELVLLTIDAGLEKWLLTLPSSWQFQTLSCAPREGFYTTRYHLYSSFAIAMSWDFYRSVRCITNDVLLSHYDSALMNGVGPGSSKLSEHRLRAARMIENISLDICDSVPYFLGRVENARSPQPGMGSCQVMWSLFCCACMRPIPEDRRSWAIQQLYQIGHGLGIHQALPIADVMASKLQAERHLERESGSEWSGTITTEACHLNVQAGMMSSHGS